MLHPRLHPRLLRPRIQATSMSRRDDPLSPAHLAALGVSTAQPDPRSVRLAKAVAVRGTRRGFQRRLSAESAGATEAKASYVVAPPRLGGSRGPSATAGVHASKLGVADDSSGVSGDGGTAPALASSLAAPLLQRVGKRVGWRAGPCIQRLGPSRVVCCLDMLGYQCSDVPHS